LSAGFGDAMARARFSRTSRHLEAARGALRLGARRIRRFQTEAGREAGKIAE
jgi:hypothetical protein